VENIVWIACVIGLATAVQSVAGFGLALVAISLLPFFLDLQMAIPLVLLMSLLNNLGLLVYYRKHFQWRAIAPLAIASLVMIPVGLWGLHAVPDAIARKCLGGFIALYVAYELLRLFLPALQRQAFTAPYWAYVLGGLSGFLTGSISTGGPPLVMYANSQAWSPESLKANLPAVYVVALSFALSGHYFEGHLTAELGQIALWSLPLFALGMGLGLFLSKRIDAVSFKRIVLALLAIIGGKLLIW
jgi:uncharacterized protein